MDYQAKNLLWNILKPWWKMKLELWWLGERKVQLAIIQILVLSLALHILHQVKSMTLAYGFQSRKRLYNPKCPFVSLSAKPPNSFKSIISPYHNLHNYSHHHPQHHTHNLSCFHAFMLLERLLSFFSLFYFM